MFLVDTCAWVEWLVDGILAEKLAPYLAAPEDLLVPTIIQFELYKWISREKDESTAMDVIAITERGHVESLNSNIALYGAELSTQHKLPMADAIIYASSQFHQIELVTCDDHFKNLPGVIYFSK